jgi:hypothetical protein
MAAAGGRKAYVGGGSLASVAGLIQCTPEIGDGLLIAPLPAEFAQVSSDRITSRDVHRHVDRKPLHGGEKIIDVNGGLRYARRAEANT